MRLFLLIISIILILLSFALGLSLLFFPGASSLGVTATVVAILGCSGFLLLGISGVLDALEEIVGYAEHVAMEGDFFSARARKEPLPEFVRRVAMERQGSASAQGVGGFETDRLEKKPEERRREGGYAPQEKEGEVPQPSHFYNKLQGGVTGGHQRPSPNAQKQKPSISFTTERGNFAKPKEGQLVGSLLEEGGGESSKLPFASPQGALPPKEEAKKIGGGERELEKAERKDMPLYIVEERFIAGKFSRMLSDGTVEAEMRTGWMRFEDEEHLREYLEATGEVA